MLSITGDQGPQNHPAQRQAPKVHLSASLDSDATAYQGLRAATVTGLGANWQEMGQQMGVKRFLTGVIVQVCIYEQGELPAGGR